MNHAAKYCIMLLAFDFGISTAIIFVRKYRGIWRNGESQILT